MDRIRVGETFQGRYDVLEKLSEGGFGMVYKARQLTTGQMVAIKVMRWTMREGADRVYLERFRRETKLCGELHHPNIVQLIDSGEAEDGMLYTVFEFIPGKDLARVLAEEGAISPRETKHLMAQVLDALSCAHAQGIVHRDLKPGNIMLVHTGARRNAKVLDFGVAGLVPSDKEKDDSQVITAPLERVGTPAYAAPEQLRGKPATARSDLYAWGLVFLECLTGKRVIRGASLPDTIYRQLEPTPIPLPSSLSDHPLGRLLRVVTVKDVNDRRITAAEALRDLEACDMDKLRISVPRVRPSSEPSGAAATAETLAISSPGPVPVEPAGPGAAVREPSDRTSADLPSNLGPHASAGARAAPASPSSEPWATSGPTPHAMVDAVSDAVVAAALEASMAEADSAAPAESIDDHALTMLQVFPEGERRQITAVSYALHVHAPTASNLDMDEHAELLSNYKALCRRMIEQAGGYVASTLGNRILAFYGYPRAQADDARRAVGTAVAALRKLAAEGRTLEQRRGARLEVQIGAHTGLVLVRGRAGTPDPSDIFGDTPVLATRIAELTSPNTFSVSAATQRLVRLGFSFGRGKTRRIDELAQPLELVEILGPAENAETPSLSAPSVSSGVQRTPLVGRAEELALLCRAWKLAREGTGQTVLVTGEAGIGKTRLARELGLVIQSEDHIWLECRCMADAQNSVLRPFVDLLERRLGYHMELSAEDKAQRLDDLLIHYGVDSAEGMPLLAPLLGVPLERRYPPLDALPHRRRELTLRALTSLLVEMASEKPLLFVVEDLHWADPTSLALLGMLLDAVPTISMCVVLTARPTFTMPWRHLAVTHIQLGRLGSTSSAAMIERLTGEHRLPSSVREQILRRTDGVPLFIEELTRAVLESGVVQPMGEPGTTPPGGTELEIPATLRDSLMARLDNLAPTAKVTAQLAAVLGREFALDQIQAVAPLEQADLQIALDALVESELVHRRRRINGDIYTFKHALVQETAYDSLPKRTRKQYHARIAEVLEHSFGDLVRQRPEVLMNHYAEAGALPRAVEYACQAGRAALQRSANQEAIAYAERGLGWLNALRDHPRRTELELGLNTVLIPAMMANYGFSSPEFRVLMRRAQEIDRGDGDPDHALHTLWGLFASHYARAEHEQAGEVAENYLEQAEKLGDAGHQVSAHTLLGINRYYRARFAEARSHLERVLELYEPGAHANHTLKFNYDTLSLAEAYLALVLWVLGEPAAARVHADRAVARADALEHPLSQILALFLAAKIDQMDGEREAVRAGARRILDIAADKDLPRWSTVGTLFMSWVDENLAAGEAALDRFDQTGHKLRRTYWSTVLAEIEMARGDFDAALDRLDDCLYVAEETQELSHVIKSLRLAGECHAQRGEHAAAEANWRDALVRAREQGAIMPALQTAVILARFLLDGGRPDEARAVLSSSLAPFAESRDTPALAHAQALLDEIDRAA
jgi:TOMM system kinase/cyclase fusion protein